MLSTVAFSATSLCDDAILGPGASKSNMESVFKEYFLCTWTVALVCSFDRSHSFVLYNIHSAVYTDKHNNNIQPITHSLATYFGFGEPSSSQYLIYGHGAFRECIHYVIPYCLQNSFF